jgi:hypothetical protein
LAVKLNRSPSYPHEMLVERLHTALDRSSDRLGGSPWSLHGLENLGNATVPDVVFTTQARKLLPISDVHLHSSRQPDRIPRRSMFFDGRAVWVVDQRHIRDDWRGNLISLLPQGATKALTPTARVRDLAIRIN